MHSLSFKNITLTQTPVFLDYIDTLICFDTYSILNFLVILLQEGPRTFVGVATFDSTIHFYNLKRALQQVSNKYTNKFCFFFICKV